MCVASTKYAISQILGDLFSNLPLESICKCNEGNRSLIKIKRSHGPMIKILHGPYERYGVIRHRKQRLRGLQVQLAYYDLIPEFEPFDRGDRVEIEIKGRRVFQCRLTFLKFFTDGSKDILCLRARDAVLEALSRFYPNHVLFKMCVPSTPSAISIKILKDLFSDLPLESTTDDWLGIMSSLLRQIPIEDSIDVIVPYLTDSFKLRFKSPSEIALDALTMDISTNIINKLYDELPLETVQEEITFEIIQDMFEHLPLVSKSEMAMHILRDFLAWLPVGEFEIPSSLDLTDPEQLKPIFRRLLASLKLLNMTAASVHRALNKDQNPDEQE